jgi:hypothetical protein
MKMDWDPIASAGSIERDLRDESNPSTTRNGKEPAMDTWMKWAWAVAAMVVVAAMMTLGHSGGGGYASVSSAPAHGSREYFTMQDPVRGVVDYGVREGGSAIVYSSIQGQ